MSSLPTAAATPTSTGAKVRKWILDGCRWKNNAFHSDPLEALCEGDKLLSHQFVFIDVLDCVFARGDYKHLRPVGRYKQSHSDASFSRNIYSPLSPESIPLQITKKYAATPRGKELARNEWEYEKISRGSVISSPSLLETSAASTTAVTTPTPTIKKTIWNPNKNNNDGDKEDEGDEEEESVDVNLMTRECAFSFIQIWLSQVIHDSDLQSEKIALSILHRVAQLPRSNHNNTAYIQAIRNMIIIPPAPPTTATVDTIMKNIFVLLITRDLVQDLRYNWGCRDLHRLRLPLRYTLADGRVWENVFFPVIIASVPYLHFSRGSLAGIVALAEVVCYHVIAPTHALATTLCTELVKRINTHALGFETALRATRAALTRWAYEQNRPAAFAISNVDDRYSSSRFASAGDRSDGYEHDLDEPKEIVLPLLVKFRASLLQIHDPSSPHLLTPRRLEPGAAAAEEGKVEGSSSSSSSSSSLQSRKRGRHDSEDEDGDGDSGDDDDYDDKGDIDYTRKCSRHLQSTGVDRGRKSRSRSESEVGGVGAGAGAGVRGVGEVGMPELFTQHSLHRAAQEAQEALLVTAASPGSFSSSSSGTGTRRGGSTGVGQEGQCDLEVLSDCIAIIERVLKKRVEDARLDVPPLNQTDPCEKEREGGGAEKDGGGGEGEGYIDMVSDMLTDLQALDLAGGLRDRDVVAAAIEKASARLQSMSMDVV